MYASIISSFCAAFCAQYELVRVHYILFLRFFLRIRSSTGTSNMNSSEFIIPQDQIKNNIVTSGFFGNFRLFGKSWGWHDVFGKFWDRQQFLHPQGGVIFSLFRVQRGIFLLPDPTMACFSVLCKLLSLMLGSSARKMGSRTRLFFITGSGAAFSFSQTRPLLVFGFM